MFSKALELHMDKPHSVLGTADNVSTDLSTKQRVEENDDRMVAVLVPSLPEVRQCHFNIIYCTGRIRHQIMEGRLLRILNSTGILLNTRWGTEGREAIAETLPAMSLRQHKRSSHIETLTLI